MNKSEEQVIRNVIARLKCEPRDNGMTREADEVREALTTGVTRIYLETWIIGALECLLPEERDLKLAKDLSE